MDRRAPLSLTFTIVGGGIAGLACAFVLQRAGHSVRVVERRGEGVPIPGGGVRSPPNMTRILNEWGFKEELDRLAVVGRGNTFRSGLTGEKIGMLVLHEQIMKDLRADYVYIQYADLHSLLHTAALRSGAHIHPSSTVISIDPTLPSVLLSTGERIESDVVIGADGFDSVVRRVGLGNEVGGVPDPRWSANLAVSAEKIKDDPELAPLLTCPELSLWMGNNASIYGHPSHNNQEYDLIFSWTTNPLQSLDEDFYTQYPVDQLGFPLESFEPKLRRLVRLAETATSVRYILREPLDGLIHESGKVILVGHAAHPIPPNGTQNSPLAIEDAAVLGNLYSRLTSRSQIPTLAGAFEDLRQPRSIQIINSEREKINFVTMPDGPEQQTRDQGLLSMLAQAAADWDKADEEYLRVQWEEYIQMFNYDANEAVDDWWTKWGSATDQEELRRAARDGGERFFVPGTLEIPASLKSEHVRSRTASDASSSATGGGSGRGPRKNVRGTV